LVNSPQSRALRRPQKPTPVGEEEVVKLTEAELQAIRKALANYRDEAAELTLSAETKLCEEYGNAHHA